MIWLVLVYVFFVFGGINILFYFIFFDLGRGYSIGGGYLGKECERRDF